jgi:hypothetical protein
MFGVIQRAARVLDMYLIAPMTGRISTASFWYIPEPPAFRDEAGFRAYAEPSGKSPLYPIDHRGKTAYPLKGDDGVIVLRYPPPTGDQINPEACFQFALGLHDRWLGEGDEALRKQFLFYASYFRSNQLENGDFPYRFDYGPLRGPWASPLAQSRGSSVMLRAFLLTGEESYKTAASKALAKFRTPIGEGGCLGWSERAQCGYFEEYPPVPSEVINGFMAAAIGPWEIAHFLTDEDAAGLAAMAKDSLEKMLPHFTLPWWTIYDQSRRDVFPNYHSSRYHRMCIGYLEVLALMFQSEIIAEHARIWRQQFTPVSRARATALKFARKSLYPI